MAALVVLATATACSSTDNGVARTNAHPSAGQSAPSPAANPPDVGVLADAGIQIVASEDDPSNGQPLRLTSVQADRLAADTGPGAGLLGRDLDAMAPVPAGTPPASYLVAAWVSAGTSSAAQTARGWMGDRDWTTAPELQFPLAAVAMFVNEMAADTARLAPSTEPLTTALVTPDTVAPAAPDPSTSDGAPAGFVARPTGLPAAPCSAVTGFLSSVINGLFDALKINPSTNGDGGVVDFFTSALATVWNVALGLAQGALEGLIANLTAPVFNAIRLAVGALGVATVVVSYFKEQSLDVTLESPQTSPDQYPFAVGSGPDVNGKFVAKGRELTGDWPAALVDCATVAGAKLPELIKPGSPANWTVDAPGLIVPGPLMGQVDSEHTASLTFVTGRESDDDAMGEAVYGVAYVTVKIPRKEVEDFLALAKAQVDGVRAQLLSVVPAAVQPAVDALLASTVDPTVDQISNEIAGSVGGPLAVEGSGRVIVLHHNPPDTTIPTPTPLPTEPDQGGDFCAQYTDLFNWVQANTPGDLAAFGAEIVRRLNEMRPSAPAELLGAVDAQLDIYGALAAGADPIFLGSKAEALGEASAVLGSYCGLG